MGNVKQDTGGNTLKVHGGGVFGSAAAPSAGYTFSHYASVAGTDTYANSTNINTPCSITTAFTNATAGDIVGIRGGTYNVGSAGGDYEGAIKPTNSGTVGNPITFAAYTGETPILNGTGTEAAGGPGGVGSTPLGANDVDYITLDGFTLTTDGGTYFARLMLGSNTGTNNAEGTYGTTNIIAKNMDIDGGTTVITRRDNIEGIRVNKAREITIENNHIHGFTMSDDYEGLSGYKSYYGYDVTIKNNNFTDCQTGIYLKSGANICAVHDNFISGCRHGIFAKTKSSEAKNVSIYNNIVYGFTTAGISVAATDSNTTNAHVYNNTVYTTDAESTPMGMDDTGNFSTGWEFYNNVLQGYTDFFGTASFSLVGTFDVCDYNMYDSGGKIRIHDYPSGNAYHTTLGALQTDDLTGLTSGSHNQNSLFANPTFTNGTGTYSLPSDFALTAATSGVGVDSLGNDMGANVTTVGIQ